MPTGLLFLLVVACSTPTPQPAPAPTPAPVPSPTTARNWTWIYTADLLNPAPPADRLWAADAPKPLEPLARQGARAAAALRVHLSRNGALLDLIERRLPAIAESAYPTRSPADAWKALQDGRCVALDYIWGAHAPKAGDPFIISTVEIGYVVTHGNDYRDLMKPYYIFRNDKRQALFVPAVADPYVTWPS